MAVFLARVDAIDRAIEADQELEEAAHQARPIQVCSAVRRH
jgi:hypothetical protein